MYGELTLRHVWRIGPLPCSQSSGSIGNGNRSSTGGGGGGTAGVLYSLGEIAVDFDIAPPRIAVVSTTTITTADDDNDNNNDDIIIINTNKKDSKFHNSTQNSIHVRIISFVSFPVSLFKL